MSYNEKLYGHLRKHRKELRRMSEFTSKIKLKRYDYDKDSIHGIIDIHTESGYCASFRTIENREKKINEGVYNMYYGHSPRFNRDLWSIDVNGRPGIRFHVANWARDLRGCVGIGLYRKDDMVYHSARALELMGGMLKIDKQYKIIIDG